MVYTASVSGPNPLEFSDPASVSESALASFHPLVFLYFMLSFFIVPYPLYQFIAKKYNWETNPRTMARHWTDSMHAFSYGVILFIFGNYTKAFSWVTVVAFYPSLFGYALIAELPYTKTSLPNIKSWPKGMWVVFLIALGLILAFAGVHIYFATQLTMPFVVYYVCGLLIPGFFLTVAVLIIKEVNNNWIRTKYHTWRQSRAKSDSIDESVTPDTVTKSEERQDPSAPIAIHNPYPGTLSLHIHHWQIFYVLAFFTRFTHPVSQVAAGIVIACYMQGICAYGYDPLVNDNH
ncbi:hypothetical protein MFLAVUS_009616 [Mucor flavus]|uniref:Uncharacterized protein n=1 Tax=Mucor flavus TaxID=439312 RepID=A0ABP9ZAE7_9FUNG